MEDRSSHRSLTPAAAAVIALITVVAGAGCAARHFSYYEDAGRQFLIPPGVSRPAAINSQVPDCPAPPVPPITPRASHQARYGCYVQTGYVDLEPSMRLKVVKPVFAKPGGESLQSEVTAQQGLNLTVRTNATGVDIQYWEVKRRQASGVSLPETGFPPEINHYRLFFLARDLDSVRKITLIGARSRAALDTATAGLDAYCGKRGSPCLAVSPGMVIGAELPVTANGRRIYVPLGATIREALTGGANAAHVRIARYWQGRAIPVRVSVPGGGRASQSWLMMPLNGGDSITW